MVCTYTGFVWILIFKILHFIMLIVTNIIKEKTTFWTPFGFDYHFFFFFEELWLFSEVKTVLCVPSFQHIEIFCSSVSYLQFYVQKFHCQIMLAIPRTSDCLQLVCWDHRVDRVNSRHHRWRSKAMRMAMIMQQPIAQHDDDGDETYDDSIDHCLNSIVSIVATAYYTNPSICYCSHSDRPYVCLKIEIQ